MTESTLQDAILLALGSQPHIRIHRQNSGRVAVVPWHEVERIYSRTNVRARSMQLAPAGAADLAGVIQEPCSTCGALIGRSLQVEVKTPAGRLSADQLNYHAAYRQRGALVLTARSIEDALAQCAPPQNPKKPHP